MAPLTIQLPIQSSDAAVFGQKRCLTIACAALVGAFGLAGCGGNITANEDKLRGLLIEKWDSKYAGMPGGLTLAIITPGGEYIASTVAGVHSDAHFRGASTTKSFTAASIMLLDQRGMLNIDDPLTANIPGMTMPYVPAAPGYAIPFKSQITIRQLLEHRAGVFDVGNTNVPLSANVSYAGQRYVDWVTENQGEKHTFTLDEMVGVVARNQLSHSPPGSSFHYSNTGYSLAAKVVEQVSGKSFAQFVKDEFVVPLGLSETTFPDNGNLQSLPAPFVEGSTKFEGKYYSTTNRNVSWGVGEGNVVTTPLNLARWIRRLVNGETNLNADQVKRMRACSQTFEVHVLYGIGIECYPTDLGDGHNGAITGYLTLARHESKANVTVVAFASLLDADDLAGQSELLIETARAARALFGY